MLELAPCRFVSETVARAMRLNGTYGSNPELQAAVVEKGALYVKVCVALATLNHRL